MNIIEILKTSLFEGYATSDLGIATILICMVCTTLIGVYIFLIYKGINKNSFYNRNFNLSLIGMAVLTAAIILTIQSNIVVSLGMVGALSIVRFRTAIKDPMDLVFLFWSISVGIICGAGFAIIAIVASACLTIIIVLFSMLPNSRGTLILVVNAISHEREEDIMGVINAVCTYRKTKARTISKSSLNLAVEIRTTQQADLIAKLMALDGITSASLVEHDGDVTV